jgi:hypothetical protein
MFRDRKFFHHNLGAVWGGALPVRTKGSNVTDAQCSCGFTEADDETIGDHLFEMFAPDDGRAPDGLVHLEGEANLFCLCGVGGSAQDLDAHFLAIFTPADLIGRDGDKHEPVCVAGKPGDR